jgi:5-methyltetrahydrofolate--homocysteine methyltransferase
VGVAGNLRSDTQKNDYVASVRAEYQDLRTARGSRKAQERHQSITDARKNRLPVDWAAITPPRPCVTGVRVLDDYPLEELLPFIDWTPFFQTWELAGHYPAILDDPVRGPAAQSLFRDAGVLLDRIVRERLLQARGVFAFFPANSVGDDIELFTDDRRTERRSVIHTLRQQMIKPPGRPNLSLADFVAPRETGIPDYVGAFAVTAGAGIDALVSQFEAAHDDYNAILTKALADRLAEAFAELLHYRVRREFWGYAPDEPSDTETLIKERYQGIRPAPGYPACPDHTEKRTLFDLLGAEERAGITLTESFAMLPTASVSGYYFWHPQSQYFGVGKIERDQAEDYAARKGMELSAVERWLSPNLNYDR